MELKATPGGVKKGHKAQQGPKECTSPESNRGLVDITMVATTKFTTNPLVPLLL